MCGVFGYIGNKNNAGEIVFKGIKDLEYRGYDSWGIAVVPTASLKLKVPQIIFKEDFRGKKSSKLNKNNILVKKNIGKIGDSTIKDLPASNLALGHTRWATHGGVTKANAHPHFDSSERIALVHNGIIENYDKIKSDLIKKGHKFLSETDTEVAAHLIGVNAEKEPDFWQAFRKSFLELSGLNALVVLDAKTQKIYAAKNGSPLVVGFGKNENYISSDVAGLLPYTKQVVFLEDDQGVILDKNEVLFIDLITGARLNPKTFIIPWSKELTSQGDYAHFMLKEIYEQPKVITNILQNLGSQAEQFAKIIKKSYGTYFVGCGTAAHACMVGQYLFSKIAKRHVNFAYGSEFGFLVDFLTKDSLVMALSQSGETIDIIDSVDKAKKKGAKIGSLVNVLGSTLYRKSDYKLLLLAGPEKAVASTKAFSAKLTILTMLAYCLNGGLNEAKKELEKTIAEMNKILKNVEVIKALAEKIYKNEHMFTIGRGLSYPIALEAALKIKEVSYIHTEGLAAGELKHGTIALITKGTPCVVFAPNDDAYGAVMSGAMELKARGAYIIGVAEKDVHQVFDYHLPVKDTGESTAISQAVVAQLLAYYLALYRGCDIDKPRNLAKSVTVK